MVSALWLVGLVLIMGCQDGGGRSNRATGADRAVTQGTPEVTVRGRVRRVVDNHVFEIAGSGGTADEAVLVVNLDSGPARLGDYVEVSGTVRPFRRALLEAEFGLRFQELVARFEGRSCIVTRRLESSLPRPPSEPGSSGGRPA